ncbi:hydroxymethylglutaryl-CoA lyase [Bacillus lacus]|uniref:Hydroxymethylglutaryl-CoA lyase n=1 Tax=Metabacillus lacus TaxID=1983721 RepID=A0A7X2J2K5_9BACI|nr:hydroxymethylglutaryl-CoA lyase [Metabacillus lacus]MRX74311.1 hydroxymethylglutaryl-CoA lyase [Metabacillus lacus]
MLPKEVTIIEVGPRDGLQNEKNFVETSHKISFIRSLKEAGVKEMELTSFVSPKWVPQMQDAESIAGSCLDEHRNFVLTPNEKGLNKALSSGCRDIAFFVGVSDSFNKHNINKTTAESLKAVLPLVERAKNSNGFVRACISTSFYCPYEGKISADRVIALSKEFVTAGADELSVADTIGMASPAESAILFSKLKDAFPDTMIAGHFHDTRGMALANIFAALQSGVNRFDTSAGGLGGCPFAPGASGNAATEDAVNMLESMGISTGINLELVLKAVENIQPALARNINSRMFTLHQQETIV